MLTIRSCFAGITHNSTGFTPNTVSEEPLEMDTFLKKKDYYCGLQNGEHNFIQPDKGKRLNVIKVKRPYPTSKRDPSNKDYSRPIQENTHLYQNELAILKITYLYSTYVLFRSNTNARAETSDPQLGGATTSDSRNTVGETRASHTGCWSYHNYCCSSERNCSSIWIYHTLLW